MPPPPVAPRTSLTPPSGAPKIPPPVTPRSSQQSLLLNVVDRPQTSKPTRPVGLSKSLKPISTLKSSTGAGQATGGAEAATTSFDSFSKKC
jgi:hypothetical protein